MGIPKSQSEHTLSNAAPLPFILSPCPHPTSSWNVPSKSVTLMIAVQLTDTLPSLFTSSFSSSQHIVVLKYGHDLQSQL